MGIVKLSTAGITNYEKYSTFLAGNSAYSPSSYDLLATEILTSSQASVTFSSLGTYAADYQHLQIRMTARDLRGASNGSQIALRFNSDTGSNYSSHNLTGNGSSVGSYFYNSTTTSNVLADIVGAAPAAEKFCPVVTDILDPFNVNKYTTVKSLSGMPTDYVWMGLYSGAWRNTASITSITLYSPFANLAANSRFSLYGLRNS